MRWVFEICLFEPNGEFAIFGKFRFSIILTLCIFHRAWNLNRNGFLLFMQGSGSMPY